MPSKTMVVFFSMTLLKGCSVGLQVFGVPEPIADFTENVTCSMVDQSIPLAIISQKNSKIIEMAQMIVQIGCLKSNGLPINNTTIEYDMNEVCDLTKPYIYDVEFKNEWVKQCSNI